MRKSIIYVVFNDRSIFCILHQKPLEMFQTFKILFFLIVSFKNCPKNMYDHMFYLKF
jgi:hypothetical protein